MVTIGWPEKAFPTKLTQRPLSEIAFLDEYGSSLPSADKIAYARVTPAQVLVRNSVDACR